MLVLHLFRTRSRMMARIEAVGTDDTSLGVDSEKTCSIVSELLHRTLSNPAETIEIALPAVKDGKGGHRMLSSLSRPPDGRKVEMARFKCFAVKLEPGEILGLMLLFRKGRKLSQSLFAGDSCAVFSHLFAISASLVARGRMLPSLRQTEHDDGHPVSEWIPVPAAEDQKLIDDIVGRMPRCCCPCSTPEHAADAFLRETTDTITRYCSATLLSEAQAARRHFYSAHDAWSASLRSKNNTVKWEKTEELKKLDADLRKWRATALQQPAKGCALHFSLNCPCDASGEWQLTIGQLTPDGVRPFDTDGPERFAWLLSLGQSIHLFPPIAAAKKRAGRLAVELTKNGAWAYLNEGRKTLEDAGYRAPPPSNVKHCEIGIAAKIHDGKPETDASRIVDDQFDVEWSITMDGEELDREETAALLVDDSPLVFFRGGWIIVDRDSLREAMRAAAKNAPEQLSGRELIGLSLGAERYRGVPVQKISAGEWLGEIISRLDRKSSIDGQRQPEYLNGEMRPYQKRGFAWLKFLAACGFGGCLADDMGLGKTVQALAFLLDRKYASPSRRPALVVAPVSILGNWMRECRTFAPSLKVHMHYGSKRLKDDAFVSTAYDCDVVLTGYPTMVRDFKFMRRLRWSAIILDEAQNIKNPDTRQASIARALDADIRIALTGTPMENHVGELWAIMDFLNPGILGSRDSFQSRFFKPIHLSDDGEAREKLRKLTAPFLLRRLKTDKSIIADLPEKIENKTYCTLTTEQASLYHSVTEELKIQLKRPGAQRTGAVFAAIMHLKQICNHPASYLKEDDFTPARSGKLTRLTEMLEECFEAGESALVFTQFAQNVKLIRNALRNFFGREMPVLFGSMTRLEREKAVESFQNGSHPQAFILSLRAGGTGLNLTRAANVFHYDRWWNPAVENQATDRAFRIGQTSNVMVHKFICTGTLEEKIDRLLMSKSLLADSIVTSGEKAFGGLTDDEIMELVKLDSGDALLDETEVRA